MIEHYLTSGLWGTSVINRVCVQQLWSRVISVNGNRQISEEDRKNIRSIMDNMPDWEPYRGSKDHRASCGEYGKQYCWERVVKE